MTKGREEHMCDPKESSWAGREQEAHSQVRPRRRREGSSDLGQAHRALPTAGAIALRTQIILMLASPLPHSYSLD